MRTYFLIVLFSMVAASILNGQTIDSTQTAFIHLYRGENESDWSYKFNVNDSESTTINAGEKYKVTVPVGSTKISVNRFSFANYLTGRDFSFKAEAGKSYYFKIQRKPGDFNLEDGTPNITFDIVLVTERMYLKETNENSH
jgi:hypothetical protein